MEQLKVQVIQPVQDSEKLGLIPDLASQDGYWSAFLHVLNADETPIEPVRPIIAELSFDYDLVCYPENRSWLFWGFSIHTYFSWAIGVSS